METLCDCHLAVLSLEPSSGRKSLTVQRDLTYVGQDTYVSLEPVNTFATLLELQGHDTALTQLHHRRGHLPEHAVLSAAQAEIDKTLATVSEQRSVYTKLAAQMAAIESQVHELDAKVEHLNAALFGAAATSPRELQAIEADIASVKKRRSELEDQELSLLDQSEPSRAAVELADTRIRELQAHQIELRAAIEVEQRSVDAIAAQRIADRAANAAMIDPALLAQYEQIRAANKGVGAAPLQHGVCMACRLRLPAVELDRIRHLTVNDLVRCDECGVILVR
jgi:uncharacterized protein